MNEISYFGSHKYQSFQQTGVKLHGRLYLYNNVHTYFHENFFRSYITSFARHKMKKPEVL